MSPFWSAFQKAMIHTPIVGLEEDELPAHGAEAAE
jgi:hypothetical protein